MTDPLTPPLLDPFDPEQLLARIAAIEPAPDATRRALARVQAALPTPPARAALVVPPPATPRRIPRWPLAAAIAATLLLAIALTLALYPRHLTPKQLLSATLKATQDYKGWIHITFPGRDNLSYHWNSQTHVTINQNQYLAPGKTTPVNRVEFIEPSTRSNFEYSSDSNIIQITAYRPDPANPADAMPIALSQILQGLQNVISQNTGIGETPDRGMQRLDITPPATPASQTQPDVSSGPPRPVQPSAIWFDPQSMLIRIVRIANTEINFSYGSPNFHTIYDAGAPQNAQVVDNRPPAGTLEVVDRLRDRLQKPFPDGVIVVLTTNGDNSSLQLYGRAANQWAMREYDVATSDNPAATNRLLIPDHWQDSAADEFFAHLAKTFPRREAGGDGTRAWDGNFNPVTGEQSLSTAIVTMEQDGTQTYRTQVTPGRQEYTGQRARDFATVFNPLTPLYPQEIDDTFSSGPHADILTSPDRPGQICLHIVYTESGIPKNGILGTLRMISQQWFDPAHNDRPVSFQRLSFVGDSRQIESHEVTNFSNYQALPAPDGRSYPTHWEQNTYDANATVLRSSTTEFHFFPGRKLPDLPPPIKKP